jgi:hypothetical protein
MCMQMRRALKLSAGALIAIDKHQPVLWFGDTHEGLTSTFQDPLVRRAGQQSSASPDGSDV